MAVDAKLEARLGQERLPEFWPVPPAALPVRPFWIPWPVAVLLTPLVWLMPKRMGPHFATVRWPGVLVAHLAWVIYGIGCIAIAYWTPHYGWAAYAFDRLPEQSPKALMPPPSPGEIARSPVALVATLLAGDPEKGISGVLRTSQGLLAGVGIVALAEAGLVVLACLLMPFATAGERGRLLFRRGVKLTLWATTSLPVLGLAFQGIELLDWDRTALDSMWLLASTMYVAWFTWIWIRSGLRYAGPAEGPTWEPHRPLCEKCGYILTGLRTGDACPECGTAVALSLPERRQLTDLARVGGLLSRPWAFMRTWRDALRPGFHNRLALNGEYPTSREFAILMCVVSSLLLQPAVLADTILNASQNRVFAAWTEFAASSIMTGIGLLLALSLLVLASRLSGHRPLRRAAPVVFYWSAWFVPLAAMLYLSLGIIYLIRRVLHIHRAVAWFPEGWPHWGELLSAAAAMLAPITFIIVAIRLARAVHQTRFANA